jgi:uncharacterized protein
MPPNHPIPDLRGEERVYFEWAERGRLAFQTCRTCGARIWYLRTVCPECLGVDLEVTAASGAGTIHSFTTLYRAGHPSRAEDVPYTVVLVDLDEGVRVIGDLVECAPDEVRIGLPVTVRFARAAEGEDQGPVVPAFVPAGGHV